MSLSLAFALAAALASAAPAPEQAVIEKATELASLDCAKPASIRNFKDFVLRNVSTDPAAGERWAACVCGDAAHQAGTNAKRPKTFKIVREFPAYRGDATAYQHVVAAWFKKFTPVNDQQARALAFCTYNRLPRHLSSPAPRSTPAQEPRPAN